MRSFLKNKCGFTPLSLRGVTGFTLVEVFVAMSILVFCVATLFISLYAGFNLINDIRENIIAPSIVQQKIEDLRKTSFTALPAYGDNSFANSSLSKLYNSPAREEFSIGVYND